MSVFLSPIRWVQTGDFEEGTFWLGKIPLSNKVKKLKRERKANARLVQKEENRREKREESKMKTKEKEVESWPWFLC